MRLSLETALLIASVGLALICLLVGALVGPLWLGILLAGLSLATAGYTVYQTVVRR